MGRILTLLIIAYVIFMIIRYAIRYFVSERRNPDKFRNENKNDSKYDKSKVVDAKFEEIKK
jgi:large-conductance mechanosensitive channel